MKQQPKKLLKNKIKANQIRVATTKLYDIYRGCNIPLLHEYFSIQAKNMNYTKQIKIYPSSALDTEYPDMIQLLCATISITKTAKACNSTATSHSISPADLARRSRTCRLSVSLPAACECYHLLKNELSPFNCIVPTC